MRRPLVVVLFGFLLLSLSTQVQCQLAQAPADWTAVERLKKGSKIIVDREIAPADGDDRTSCKVVRVDASLLVCTPEGRHAPRLVYPAQQVASVYLRTMHLSPNFVKMVLYGGLGWVAGGIITDDKWDYPLATLGAAAGALYGLTSKPPQQRQILVYARVPAEPITSAPPLRNR